MDRKFRKQARKNTPVGLKWGSRMGLKAEAPGSLKWWGAGGPSKRWQRRRRRRRCSGNGSQPRSATNIGHLVRECTAGDS